MLEIDDPDELAAHLPLGRPVLDGDAVDDQPVRVAVTLEQARPLDPQELALRVLECFGR